MNNSIVIIVAIALGSALLFFVIGWIVGRSLIRAKFAAAQKDAAKIIADAQKEAETMFKEKMLELKDEQLRLRTDMENEMRQKRDELARMERSLKDREGIAKAKAEDLDRKNKEAERLVQSNTQREKAMQQKQAKIDAQEAEAQAVLERVAGLTKEQASE